MCVFLESLDAEGSVRALLVVLQLHLQLLPLLPLLCYLLAQVSSLGQQLAHLGFDYEGSLAATLLRLAIDRGVGRVGGAWAQAPDAQAREGVLVRPKKGSPLTTLLPCHRGRGDSHVPHCRHGRGVWAAHNTVGVSRFQRRPHPRVIPLHVDANLGTTRLSRMSTQSQS